MFTHFKPFENFQYTHFKSSHPPEVKKGFVKGETIQLLRTNSNENNFWTQINNFKKWLLEKEYKETQTQQKQALNNTV